MKNDTLDEYEDFDMSGNLTFNESKTTTEARPCIGLTQCTPFIAAETIIALASIIGNGLFIFAFLRVQKLRKQQNYLLISLSVVDLFMGLIFVPVFIINSYLMDNVPALNYLTSEKYFCIAKLSVGSALICVSFFHQLHIAIERYVKICRSTLYMAMFSKKRLLIIILTTWLYGIAINIPPLLGWNEWTPEKECRGPKVTLYHLQFVIVPHEPICMVAVFGLYVAIFCHVRQHRNRMKKHAANHRKKPGDDVRSQPSVSKDIERFPETRVESNSVPTADQTVSSDDNVAAVASLGQSSCSRGKSHGKPEERAHHSKSALPSSVSTKHAGKSTNEMEIRVAKMTAIVVGTFTLLFIPNVIVVLSEKYFNDNKVLFGIFYYIAIECVFLSSVTNPFIYGILNREIREAMLKSFKCG